MLKKEVLEIKKQFKKTDCGLSRIAGCYVDGNKEKITYIESGNFLNIDEDEMYKYLELARKTLSGTLGNNLLEYEFPLEEERTGGHHQLFMWVRESQLKNPELLDTFYEQVIENFDYAGNYLILLFYGAYDIPVRTKDNIKNQESDEVYEYMVCTICPVTLSKPGLSYLEEENMIGLRKRDWIVAPPESGFLFPAFNDRSTDIHAVLHYSKDPKKIHEELVSGLFGCNTKMSAAVQKEAFHAIVQETLGEECNYETVTKINEKLADMLPEQEEVVEEAEEAPQIVEKEQLKRIFEESGVSEEAVEHLDEAYENNIGSEQLYVENIVATKPVKVKTNDIVLNINPEVAARVKSTVVDGQKCLLIPINSDENITINGVDARP